MILSISSIRFCARRLDRQPHQLQSKMLLSSSSLRPLLLSILLASADLAAAASASSWSFRDGNLAVQSKGSGVNKAKKVDLNVKKPLSKPITLGNADTIKIQFTATENGSPKKPNQAMLLLKEQETGLETFFAAQTRDSGKSTITFVRTPR